MKQHSFRLTKEDSWKLQNIQELQEHENVSETVRFCIEFVYEALCQSGAARGDDKMLALVRRNNLMLRFLFIELAKMHGGEVKALTFSGRKYLENLKQQLTDYMENHDERTPGL